MKGTILALDISSRSTGWAVFKDGRLTDYGMIKIDPKNGWGFRLSVFGEEIKRLLEEYDPERVVIEDIYRGPSALTFKVLSFFHGVAYKAVNDILYSEPVIIGVSPSRKIIGDHLDIVCRTKEQAFFIMNTGLKLGLNFKEGNDITDACLLAYCSLIQNGEKPAKKLRINKTKYEEVTKHGSTQSTGRKKKRIKRGSKKSVSKVSKRVSSRRKSK